MAPHRIATRSGEVPLSRRSTPFQDVLFSGEKVFIACLFIADKHRFGLGLDITNATTLP
jgi:hypothetical protein